MKNSKTLSKKNNGFTILELIIVISVLMIIFSTVYINLNPVTRKKSARDSLRLSNLNEIERVINEYFLDNGKYPGEDNVLYVSTTVNWIPIPNIYKYISKLPVDPGENFYYYKHDISTYEVNVVLENSSELMSKDNGNNINRYEVGNNLLLIAGD